MMDRRKTHTIMATLIDGSIVQDRYPGTSTIFKPVKNVSELLCRHSGLKLKHLRHKCSEYSVAVLAKKIAKWRDLAFHFDMTAANAEAIEHDGVDEEDKRRKLLLRWIAKYGDEATYYNLINKLLRADEVQMADDVCHHVKGQIIEKSQDLMIQVFKQLCDAIGSNPLLLAKNLYENHYITDSDYTNANDSDLLNIALDDVDLRTATLLNSIIRVIKKGNLEILPEIIDQLQHQSMGRKLKQKYEEAVSNYTNQPFHAEPIEQDTVAEVLDNLFECLQTHYKKFMSNIMKLLEKLPPEDVRLYLRSWANNESDGNDATLETHKMIENFIQERCSCSQIKLVKEIVSYFRLHKATDAINQYMKTRHELWGKIQLEHSSEVHAVLGNELKNQTKVVFKVKEKKSLRDFVESLEKAIGSVHVESINIEGVHHSTVTVLCSIPRWMKGAFKRTMKEKERALREQDIFSVEIDEEEMLQEGDRLPQMMRFAVDTIYERNLELERIKMEFRETILEHENQAHNKDIEIAKLERENDMLVLQSKQKEKEHANQMRELEEKIENLTQLHKDITDMHIPVATHDDTDKYMPPVDVKVEQVQEFISRRKHCYSPSFYSHNKGYQMCLKIDPSNGCLSLYIHLMRGGYDDHLPWPFRGTVRISLLGEEGNHRSISTTFDETTDPDACTRVTSDNGIMERPGLIAGHGHGRRDFITTTELEDYTFDDTITFRVLEVTAYNRRVAVPSFKADSAPQLKMLSFSRHMKSGDEWKSEGFSSGERGYEFQLLVYANGKEERKGESVSAYVHIKKGKHDDELKFPFRGEVKVQMVNVYDGSDKSDHTNRGCPFNNDTDPHGTTGARVTGKDLYNQYGIGYANFIPHNLLQRDNKTRSQYIDNNDCVTFKITSITVDSVW